MKISTRLISATLSLLYIITLASCESGRSYAELLTDENHAVNRFLLDHNVAESLPENNNFIVGETAPYYPLDDEGNVYMQVLSLGEGQPLNEDTDKDLLVYFRFLRYPLSYYYGSLDDALAEGNQDNMGNSPTSFRYQNFTLPSSSRWGTGLQMPLQYVPIGSEINLIVKSQYGWSSEISNVIPYLYHVRYYKSQI